MLMFFGWTLYAPSLNALYQPASGFTLNNPASWGPPVWDGNGPEPSAGPDEGDFDGDHLPDWFENWYELVHAPAGWSMGSMYGLSDSDYDGATDESEIVDMGSDPFDAYSLGIFSPDGVTRVQDGDYWEAHLRDDDGDGLSNWDEQFAGTDSSVFDTDGDGWGDGAETQHGTTSATDADSDDDLLTDWDDVLITEYPTDDFDGDGLTNADEYNLFHTSVRNSDTDGDSLSDGYELLTTREGESKSASDPNDSDTNDDQILDGDDPANLFPSDRHGDPLQLAVSFPSPGSLPAGTSDSTYSSPAFEAVNANGACFWNVTGGTLPTSLTFDGPVLTGSASAGVYEFTVQVTDGDGYSATADYTLVIENPVEPLALNEDTLQGAEFHTNDAIQWQFGASGGSGGYEFSAPEGLPSGLSLSSSGLLEGTVSDTGDYQFLVQVIDSAGSTISGTAHINITQQPPEALTITSSDTLSEAHDGEPYSWSFTAQNGSGSRSWSYTGDLPLGLLWNSDSQSAWIEGSCSGAIPGTYVLQIQVTSDGETANQTAYLTVVEAPPPEISIDTPTSLTVSLWTPFTHTFTASGGSGGACAFTSPDLPLGLSLDTGGVITGILENASPVSFTLDVTDGVSSSSSSITLQAVDQDADSDGLLASKEHELALAWNVLLHDGDSHSSRGTGSSGPHDWLFYYHSELFLADLQTDADEDGLGSQLEAFLGTNPSLSDTDGDHKPDWWQRYLAWDWFFDQRDANGVIIDGDGDGLPYSLENMIGSYDDAAFGYDSDADGLPDSYEWGTSIYSAIMVADTDGDGLSDSEEYAASTYARLVDSDNDHLSDREELHAVFGIALDPLDDDSDDDGFPDWTEVDLTDTDAAGIPDRLEIFWGMNKSDPADELLDVDGDGTSNLTAYQIGWDIFAAYDPLFDRDHDGMTNIYELSRSLNPEDIQDGADDPDGDFLTNAEEYAKNTSHTLLLTPARARVYPDDPNSALRTLYDYTLSVFRPVENDFESVFMALVPPGLLRDDGPLAARQYEDDWDQDGTNNVDELYPLSGPASDPRAWNAPLVPLPPASAVQAGRSYDELLLAQGGFPPYQFTLKANSALPAWLSLEGNRLTGTAPITLGVEPTFTLLCQDVRGTLEELAVTMNVVSRIPVFAWTTPANMGTVTVTASSGAYLTTLGTEDQEGSVTFAPVGDMPGDWTLSPEGQLTASSSGSMTVSATDSATPPHVIFRTFTLTVVSYPPPELTNTNFIGAYGVPLNIQLNAIGGDGQFSFGVNALPDGLSLDGATGVISGTPAGYGDTQMTVSVTSAGESAVVDHVFKIASSPVEILTDAELPSGRMGNNYVVQFLATGGRGPISFTATGLPDGLQFDSSGQLHGIPTELGTFLLSVTATDSIGLRDFGLFSVQVTPPPPELQVSVSGDLTARVGTPHFTNVSVTGGQEPYEFIAGSGGGIRSVFSTPGVYEVTVAVRDAVGAEAGSTLSVTVEPALVDIGGNYQVKMLGESFDPVTLIMNGDVVETWNPGAVTVGMHWHTFADPLGGQSHAALVVGLDGGQRGTSYSGANNSFVPPVKKRSAPSVSDPMLEHRSLEVSSGTLTGERREGYYAWTAGTPKGLELVDGFSATASKSGNKWETSDPAVKQDNPNEEVPELDDLEWSPGVNAAAYLKLPPDGQEGNVSGLEFGTLPPPPPFYDISEGYAVGKPENFREKGMFEFRIKRDPADTSGAEVTRTFFIQTEQEEEEPAAANEGNPPNIQITAETCTIPAGQAVSNVITVAAAEGEKKTLLPVEFKMGFKDDEPITRLSTGEQVDPDQNTYILGSAVPEAERFGMVAYRGGLDMNIFFVAKFSLAASYGTATMDVKVKRMGEVIASQPNVATLRQGENIVKVDTVSIPGASVIGTGPVSYDEALEIIATIHQGSQSYDLTLGKVEYELFVTKEKPTASVIFDKALELFDDAYDLVQNDAYPSIPAALASVLDDRFTYFAGKPDSLNTVARFKATSLACLDHVKVMQDIFGSMGMDEGKRIAMWGGRLDPSERNMVYDDLLFLKDNKSSIKHASGGDEVEPTNAEYIVHELLLINGHYCDPAYGATYPDAAAAKANGTALWDYYKPKDPGVVVRVEEEVNYHNATWVQRERDGP
jgi:hypothetical protein